MKSRPAVLLVEDSEDDAYFFRRAFKKAAFNCELTHVLDGDAAIRTLCEQSLHPERMPDLIFLDLKMPVMNGFEVLEWIRQQPFAGSFQVIVLSGSDHQEDQERAQALGACHYLVKPIRAEQLREIFQRLAAGSAFVSGDFRSPSSSVQKDP